MSNHLVPATAGGMPTTTRRAVLIGGVSTAALAAPAAASALRPLTSWMGLKIAAHREAAEVEGRLDHELALADARFDADQKVRPILVVIEDQWGKLVTMDLGEHGREEIEAALKKVLRASMDYPLTGFYGPGNLEQLAGAVDVARDRHARNLAAYRAASEEETARLAHFGIAALQDRLRAAHRREADALSALLAERPRSIEDVEARMRYLAEAELLPVLSRQHVAALFGSMTGGEA